MLSRRQFLVTAGLVSIGLKPALGFEQTDVAQCVQRSLGGRIYKIWSSNRNVDEPMKLGRIIHCSNRNVDVNESMKFMGHIICSDMCSAIRSAHYQWPDLWLRITGQEDLIVEIMPNLPPRELEQLIKTAHDDPLVRMI